MDETDERTRIQLMPDTLRGDFAAILDVLERKKEECRTLGQRLNALQQEFDALRLRAKDLPTRKFWHNGKLVTEKL